MRLRIKEGLDNIKPEWGVLVWDDVKHKNYLANFYDDKEQAFEFVNDYDLFGDEIWDRYHPDIIAKNTRKGFEPDSNGSCYYTVTTADGDVYLQEVRLVNQDPLVFNHS